MGNPIRSATKAANGIPAVSPPAILSKTSKPTLRITVMVKKSIIIERALGKEINFLQSIYVGLSNPDARVNGFFELK